MKISLLHKCIISFIGIILITSIIQNLLKKNEKIQEGLDMPSGDQIGNMIKDGFMSLFDKIKNGFDQMVASIMGIINKIQNFFDHTLRDIGQDLEYAFEDIGNGIKLEFKNLGIGLKTGFQDIFEYMTLFKYVFSYIDDVFTKYIGSRINCGLQKIGKIRSCFIFYFMDMIGHILYYVFVFMPVWIIKLVTNGFIDLQPSVDLGQNMIDCIDDFSYGMSGYHIVHYPQWVLDECYLCKLKDMPAFPLKPFQDQAHKINIDWNKALPELLNQPLDLFKDAGYKFKSAFNWGGNVHSDPYNPSDLPSITDIERKYGVNV